MQLAYKNIFHFLFLLVFSLEISGQDSVMDSLKLALKNAKHDTTRCAVLYQMAETEPDDKLWPLYNEQLLKTAEKGAASSTGATRKVFLEYQGSSLNNAGLSATREGDFSKAHTLLNKSLKVQEEAGNKYGIAISLNNIGFNYEKQGDNTKALEFYHKSLEIFEALKQNLSLV